MTPPDPSAVMRDAAATIRAVLDELPPAGRNGRGPHDAAARRRLEGAALALEQAADIEQPQPPDPTPTRNRTRG